MNEILSRIHAMHGFWSLFSNEMVKMRLERENPEETKRIEEEKRKQMEKRKTRSAECAKIKENVGVPISEKPH